MAAHAHPHAPQSTPPTYMVAELGHLPTIAGAVEAQGLGRAAVEGHRKLDLWLFGGGIHGDFGSVVVLEGGGGELEGKGVKASTGLRC